MVLEGITPMTDTDTRCTDYRTDYRLRPQMPGETFLEYVWRVLEYLDASEPEIERLRRL